MGFWDNLIFRTAYTLTGILFLIGFVTLGYCLYLVYDQAAHTCQKWTEPYDHPQYRVFLGKTWVSHPGGVWSDCVGR